MNVLVIVPEFVTYGGTARFLERLLELHLRQGFRTILLTSAAPCHSALSSLAQRCRAELVFAPNRARPGTAPLLTPWYDLLFSWRTLRASSPDLIVVSTADPGRMSIALYVPVPVLYILHSIPEKRFRWLPRFYLRVGSMLRNRIVTVSRAAADAIAETMGIPHASIQVVHNSVPAAGDQGTKNKGQSVVLTAGHLVDYKNPWLWLDVARMVLAVYPAALFVWLGDGELLESVRSKVRELSMEDRILLPGYVETPSSWYRKASIYLQPSRRESHGIAVLEAMAHGLPCVVADSGGLPESVLDGETGYVCPLADPAGFAGRITMLLSDPALRSSMGVAGRQRVETCFSEASQDKKLLSLYKQLAEQA